MDTSARTRVTVIGVALALSLAIAGCGGSSKSSSSGAGGKSVSTQPLTGLPLAAGTTVAQRPALFVKIENAPQARPQSGLDKADVVYEAVAEGGITRFAAVFQSEDPGELGPVRSVRPQDPDLSAPLHGVAAFSGGVAPIVADLSTVAQNLSADVPAGAPAYHRTADRVAPHNLYATASKLWAAAQLPYDNPPQPLFHYGAIPAGATVATSVDVPLSASADVSWKWDGTAWRRSQDGQPSTVTGTGRIGPANVIIQYVQIVSAGYADVAGTPVPSSVVVGTGKAILLRDGKAITGTWTKAGRSAVTQFMGADGKQLNLHPGSTWVELLPATATAKVTP